MPNFECVVWSCVIITLAGTAWAQDNASAGLKAHVHGHATLNIAIEGKRVDIELEVPGADIIGFEHEATTKEQVTAEKAGKDKLGQLTSVVKLPAAAGCSLASTQVEHHHQKPSSDAHDDAAHLKDAASHHNDEESDHKHSEVSGHAEFHATYVLDCGNPEKLSTLNFTFFNSFSGADEMEVNVIGQKGQKRFEVTRDAPQISLAGIM